MEKIIKDTLKELVEKNKLEDRSNLKKGDIYKAFFLENEGLGLGHYTYKIKSSIGDIVEVTSESYFSKNVLNLHGYFYEVIGYELVWSGDGNDFYYTLKSITTGQILKHALDEEFNEVVEEHKLNGINDFLNLKKGA